MQLPNSAFREEILQQIPSSIKVKIPPQRSGESQLGRYEIFDGDRLVENVYITQESAKELPLWKHGEILPLTKVLAILAGLEPL